MLVPVKELVPFSKGTVPGSDITEAGNCASGTVPLVKLLAFRPVRFEPLPAKELAVIVPAEKLPVASRLTSVPGVLAVVAPLAALAPLATLPAVTPPTLDTTVAPCVPVTSPESGPVKLVAVLAKMAVVALVALPARLPEKTLLVLVAMTTPV